MTPALWVAVALAFLVVLAVLAFIGDRYRRALGPWLEHPVTYTLALSVYYTGWAYFGTGAAFWEAGVAYMAHEMGWSLTFLFGWPLLLKALRFMQAHRVTTLPGALTIRYGASPLLTGLVVAVMVVALLPYIALQLQAIAFSVRTLSADGSGPGFQAMILAWTLIVALFAILFGARQPDPTLRHPGVVAAMAVSGVVKLVAVALVAGVAIWRFPQLLTAPGAAVWPDMTLGSGTGNSYLTWIVHLIVSMAGVLLLPHVFHLAVVEAGDERQVHVAKWAFPLYGWLFELLLIPIMLAGAALGLSGPGLQEAILRVPTTTSIQGVAFIGGVAAATGMAVVTLIALANMLLIDVLLPAWPRALPHLSRRLLPLRWALILALALASFALWNFVRHDFLFQLGLDAFVAVAQLAPAFFLGLVWPRLRLMAVLWGLALSLLGWLYTAFLPSLATASGAIARLVADGPWGIGLLRPQALLGIEGFPPAVHAFLWCTLLNLGAMLLVTLRQAPSHEQEQWNRDLVAGQAPGPGRALLEPVSLDRVAEVLTTYLGPERSRSEVARLRSQAERDGSPEIRSLAVRDRLERLLRGPLGPVTARRVIDPLFPTAEQGQVDILEAYRKLEQLLELNQEDLANRLRELSVLNLASERLVALEEPSHQLAAISELLARTFHLDLVGGYLLEDHHLVRCAEQGFRHANHRVPLTAGSALERVVQEQRLTVMTRSMTDLDRGDPLLAEGAQTMAYVPMVHGERVLGLLACGVRGVSFYMSEEFLALLQAIANNLAVALSAAQHRQKEALLKAQYETTLANLSDAVRVADRSGRTIFVNEAFMDLTQAPDRATFQDLDFPEFYAALSLRDGTGEAIPRDETPSMRALRARAVQHVVAARLRTFQGLERILNISSVPVLDSSGEVTQVVTVYRDITELYSLKEALEQRVAERTQELATERDRLEAALDDLRNLEKVKAAFINAVSHDLRIPLTGIVGYAEFIEDEIGGPVSEEQRQYAQNIIEASRRMTALLNELLDFARMEAGRFTVEPRPVPLSAVVHETVTTFMPVIEKQDLTLTLDLAPDLPEVLADPARVIQVLSNLLSNAVKFTPRGGRLTVRARPDHGALRVEVADTGVGIPAEDLPHMFERFYQTKAGTQAGGTGLGLSIAKALIEAHGGQIGVRSQEGEGTTFWFTLPFAAEASDA